MGWFEEYLRQGWGFTGDTKPVDPDLWFNLEADLTGKHVVEHDYVDGEYELVANYDVVYAKPSSYRWLD